MEGGIVRPTPFFGVLPFTQNIFRQPMPENSWPCKTLFWMPLWRRKNEKINVIPSQSTLKYGSENNLWMKGLRGTLCPRLFLFYVRTQFIKLKRHLGHILYSVYPLNLVINITKFVVAKFSDVKMSITKL